MFIKKGGTENALYLPNVRWDVSGHGNADAHGFARSFAVLPNDSEVFVCCRCPLKWDGFERT